MPETKNRQPAADVLPLFVQRWSPRSFQQRKLDPQVLMSLLEAARWAPSRNNSQPWRLVYALNGDAHWGTFKGLLNEKNARWAGEAAALVLMASSDHFTNARTGEHEHTASHEFDAGCAWGYMALQAASLGWACHAMAGFDAGKARVATRLPDDCKPHALIAIGVPGDPATLPDDLRAREKPSGREPVGWFSRHGCF
jgi:nitroreductase